MAIAANRTLEMRIQKSRDGDGTISNGNKSSRHFRLRFANIGSIVFSK